jgi:hypothetical protein
MANLIFMPIADQIESGTYLLYDGAIGTGGAELKTLVMCPILCPVYILFDGVS